MTETSRMYLYSRSRQLEGTYNNDASIGAWPVSGLRVLRGWGCPPEELWPYVGDASLWPPKEEPANIDNYAKENRIFAYQRVKSSGDCKLVLVSGLSSIVCAVEITRQWFDANSGEITMPRNDEEIIGSHCIVLAGHDYMKKTFTFANSWGTEWGDEGYGYLPYEYVDSLLEEAWVMIRHEDRRPEQSGTMEIEWCIPSILHDFLYGVEIRDTASDDRKGWAFALNYDGHLNIEEFFVMPNHRGKGLSKALLKYFSHLSNLLSLPLRIWVSHADSEERNLQIINHLAHDNDLVVSNSPVRWASFLLERGGAQTLKGGSHRIPGIPHPSSDSLPILKFPLVNR